MTDHTPPTDQTPLRTRIAEALAREDAHNWGYDHGFVHVYGGDPETDGFVDAIMAVLPPVADRAAILREAADQVADLDRRNLGIAADTIRDAWEEGRDEGADLLRRLAAEAQPECIASISGSCLRESQSETACDTEAGECVHGGRPGAEARQQPDTETLPPAATCSAQYHGTEEVRHCIRAAQHTGKAHTDANGFHWSDTVAVYPAADGTFRTGNDDQEA